MTKVLLTGANGFIGRSVYFKLVSIGYDVVATTRTFSDFSTHSIGNIDEHTDWSNYLRDCSIVIHLAGKVHDFKNDSMTSIDDYRKVNVRATYNLASQSAILGIKRFIYISTIKVNGDNSGDKPFTSMDLPNPTDPYSISKFEAEETLKNISLSSNMEYTIIRPPLVYGFGVKGNLLSIINLIHKGVPLPLGGIYNKRSFISIDNLVDFITLCIKDRNARNETFLISDFNDLSTTELVNKIYFLMRKSNRLFTINPSLFKVLLQLLHRDYVYDRLYNNLQIDKEDVISRIKWSPIVDINQGLKKLFINN